MCGPEVDHPEMMQVLTGLSYATNAAWSFITRRYQQVQLWSIRKKLASRTSTTSSLIKSVKNVRYGRVLPGSKPLADRYRWCAVFELKSAQGRTRMRRTSRKRAPRHVGRLAGSSASQRLCDAPIRN